jgi:hypothetical protein
MESRIVVTDCGRAGRQGVQSVTPPSTDETVQLTLTIAALPALTGTVKEPASSLTRR